MHENSRQTVYKHYALAELISSSKKQLFGYMKLHSQIQGFVLCLGINFKVKLACAKKTEVMSFLALYQKVPGHGMPVCL